MAKKLNKNLVGGLTIFGMLATFAAGAALVAYLPDKDPGIYVEQAKTQEEKGDPGKAIGLYGRAYQVSRDPKFLIDMGRLLHEQDDSLKAVQMLKKSISENDSDLRAHEQLLTIMLDMARIAGMARNVQWWSEIQSASEKMLTVAPESPMAHHGLGMSLLGLRTQARENEEAGLKELQYAVKLAPDNAEYAGDLALYLESLKDDPPEVETIYTDLIKANPDDSKARRIYGEYLGRKAYASGQKKDAENEAALRSRAKAELEKARDLDPDEPDNYIALGRLAYLTRDENGIMVEGAMEEATDFFKQATDVDRDAYKSYLALGLLHVEQGDYEGGLAVFRERLKVPPVRKGFMERIRRANHFMLLRHASRAALYLAEKLTKDESQREGYIAEAEEFLKQAKAEMVENPITFQMEGEILLVKREHRLAIQAFEKSERLSPGPNPETKRHLAGLYDKTGADGKAEQTYIEFLELYKATGQPVPAQVLLDLGKIHNELNKPQQALVRVREAQELYAEREDVLIRSRQIEMEAYRQLERYDDVERISKLLGSDDMDSLKREVQIALMREDFETAEVKLRKILEDSPSNALSLKQMVAILLKKGQKEEAIVFVDKAIEDKPNRPGLKRLKFALSGKEGEDRTDEILELIGETEDPVLRALEFAKFHSRAGTPEGNRESMKHLKVAEEQLQDPEVTKDYRPGAFEQLMEVVMESQFGIARSDKNWAEAEDIVRRAKGYNADSVGGLFFQGRLDLVRGNIDQALVKLRGGLELMPNSPQGLQWLGAALLKAGQLAEAQAVFENTLAVSPNNGYAHLGMAQLAATRGDQDTKVMHLKECARIIPNEPWVQDQMQILTDEENPADGIARREELLKKNPDDLENQIRLAFLYLKAKQPEKGEEALLSALSKDPTKPELVAEAANYYRSMDQDKDRKGVALLNEYIQAAPEPDDKAKMQLFLARHWWNLGDDREADNAYKKAGEISQTTEVCVTIGRWLEQTRRPKDALIWFRKAVSTPEKPSQYAWRLLLDTLLNHPGLDNPDQDAVKYCEIFPEDTMGLIYLGRTALGRGQTDEALEKFNEFIDKNPDNETGYFLRGHVRSLRNQYREAIVDLERAKAIAPDGFGYQHRLRLARAKENIGALDEAIGELNGILQETPTVGLVARALSEMYERHERYAEQDALLVRYASLQPNEWFWPLARGRVLTKLDRSTAALNSVGLAINRAQDYLDGRFLPLVMDEGAAMLLKLRQFDELIKRMEQVAPDRRTPSLWRRLARARFMKGDKAAALADFEQGLATASVSHESYMQVVQDMADLYGPEELLTLFRDRLAKNKDDRQAERLVAEVLMGQDNASSEALATLERLLASAPEQERIPLLIRIGVVYYSQKKYNDAVAAYEKALEIDPHHAFVLNNLAYILAEDLGRPQEALPYALQAAEIHSDANINDTVGWTYALTKRYPDAIAWLLRAVEADDSLAVAAWHLAEAYRLNGENVDAERAVQRAYQLVKDKPNDPYRGPILETMRQLNVPVPN
jgi:tetratricopeptide (TPR) repeat protein